MLMIVELHDQKLHGCMMLTVYHIFFLKYMFKAWYWTETNGDLCSCFVGRLFSLFD